MAGSAYSIIVDTELDLSNIQKQLKGINGKVNLDVDSNGIKSAKKEVDSLKTSAKDVSLTFQEANMIMQGSLDIIKSMVDQVFELDSAMTEFRKVSDFSTSELDSYVDRLSEVGKTLGRTGSEMLDAATQFKKNSFNEEDSAILAEVAAKFTNIADTQISTADAASFLISQMKAFNIEADESYHIIDATNEVANSFAVGTNDLSTALIKAGTSLSSVGNTFEETIGLVTAGTEILVGQPSKVGNGLRTIGLNIAALAKESENYVAANGAVNISLRDSQGEMRSTYDILKDLYEGVEGQSKAWKELSTVEQAAIGEALAGKNQYNVLTSVMTNFSSAISATETALNSAGSATRENAAYMESLEAKVSNLKNVFQEFSNNVINSDLVKGFLDLAINALELLNTEAGQTITQFTLLTGVLTGGFSIFGKVAEKITGSVSAFTSFVGGASKATEAATVVGEAVETMTKKGSKGAGFLSKLSSGFGGLSKSALPIAGLISGIAVALGFFNKAIEYSDPMNALEKESNEAATEVQRLKTKLDELKSTGAPDSVIQAYANQIDYLEQKISDLDIDKLRQIVTASPGGNAQITGMNRMAVTGEMLDMQTYMSKAIEQWNYYKEARDKALRENDFEGLDKATDKIMAQEVALSDYWQAAIELYAKSGELPEELTNKTVQMGDEVVSALDFFQEHFGETIDEAAAKVNSLSGQLTGLGQLRGAFDPLNQAIEEFNNAGQPTLDTLINLNSVFGEMDGWDEYVEKLMSGTTTTEEFNAIVSDLVYSLLEASLGAENLANITPEVLGQFLEGQGVANAYALATELVAKAQQEVTNNPANTEESQAQMEAEGNQASKTKDQVDGVTDAQRGVTNNPISTASSQTQLWTLADVANQVKNQVINAWNAIKSVFSSSPGSFVSGIGADAHGRPVKAQGGKVEKTGQYWVGEQGPEIVTLPEGATVTSNKKIKWDTGVKVDKGDVTGGYAQGTRLSGVNRQGDANRVKDPYIITLEDQLIDYSNNVTTYFNKAEKGAQKVVELAEEENEELEKQIKLYNAQTDILEHKLFLLEKNGASETEQIQLLRKMQEEASSQANEYRKQGYDDESEVIRDLQKQWWDFEDQINDLQQDAFDKRLERSENYIEDRNYYADWGADSEIDAWKRVLDWMDNWYKQGLIDYEYYLEQREDAFREYEDALRDSWEEEADAIATALDVVAKKAQEEIDALEDQKQAIEDKYQDEIDKLQQQNDLLNDQITLQEKLDALARAKQQRLLVYKDGRFQYIQDIDAVSKAQADLDAYNREKELEEQIKQLEENRDKELAILDEKIKYWQWYVDEYGSAIDKVGDLQDELLAEQVLGIKLEGENWEKRLDNLQNYVDRYIALMQQLQNQEWITGEGEDWEMGEGPGSETGSGGDFKLGDVGTAWIPGVGVVKVDLHDNKVWTGLPEGAIVSTAGGDYKITGGTPGNYTSEKVDESWRDNIYGTKPGGSSGGSSGSSGSISSGIGSVTGSIGSGIGSAIGGILGGKHAKGTLSAPGGISLVGENGPELRLLNSGDGILPNDITRNLWGWGSISPIDFANNQTSSIHIDIKEFSPNLPNVSNGEDFVYYLKNNFWQSVVQYQSKR